MSEILKEYINKIKIKNIKNVKNSCKWKFSLFSLGYENCKSLKYRVINIIKDIW